MRNPAVIGHEFVCRIFGGDSALNRETIRLNRVLRRQLDRRIAQRHTLSNQNLRPNNIDARDFFGHGMFDLNSWVDFDEIKLVGIGIDQEFDRAGVFVLHRAADVQRRFAQRLPDFWIEIWSRRYLDNFLMPTLYRAVSFEQVHQVAMLVTQQLDFDVASPLDELLDKNVRAAKRRERFATSLLERRFQVCGIAHHAHAASAAAVSRF